MSKLARRCRAQVSFKRLFPIALISCTLLSGCSSALTRFDYPVFGFGSSDSETTGAISPEKPVYGSAGNYQNSASANSRGGDYSYSASQNYGSSYGSNQAVSSRAPVANVTRYDAPSYAPTNAPQYQDRSHVLAARSPSFAAPQPRRAGADGAITVRQGDTLYNIARSNNVSLEELKRVNGMSGNNLRVGQRLVMPGSRNSGQTTAATSSAGGNYTVRSGDTIYSIAIRHGLRHDELARMNNISDPNSIRLGQKLTVRNGARAKPSVKPIRVRTVRVEPHLKPSSVQAAPKGGAGSKPQKAKQSGTEVAMLPKPEPRSQGRFRWPVRGRIISKFGPKSDGTHNDGINIAVPGGTSIKAVENGVVAYAGNELKGYGNLVLVRHSDGWVSAYAHNERLLVKRGDKITRGQVIAKAGRTGSVRQPQLHFELRRGSKPVDPMKYMAAL